MFEGTVFVVEGSEGTGFQCVGARLGHGAEEPGVLSFVDAAEQRFRYQVPKAAPEVTADGIDWDTDDWALALPAADERRPKLGAYPRAELRSVCRLQGLLRRLCQRQAGPAGPVLIAPMPRSFKPIVAHVSEARWQPPGCSLS